MSGLSHLVVDDESDQSGVIIINNGAVVEPETPEKKKRGRKKSTEIKVQEEPQTSISYTQGNIPYMNAYNETNMQLDSAIHQLDVLGGNLMMELENIRGKNTLKNKYNYVNDMTQTLTSIITSKISAIKEKNKTINDVNNIEIRRIKELKLSMSQEDDNTKISNLYNAFINTPIGNNINRNNLLGPSMSDLTINGGTNLPSYQTMSNPNDQIMWENSLDPASSRMVLEAKGQIETVVMYDQSSGDRWFEVIDKATGQPMPGVEKPNESFIYELTINVNGGYAKNSNLNITYPLIVVGTPNNLAEY